MRFFTNLSTALLSALLATSVVGDLITPSDDASFAIEKRARAGLGPGPKVDYKKLQAFCGKPFKKTGKRDLTVLETRAPPAGAIIIQPGAGGGAKPNQGPLYSQDFGTCIGVAITGTPKKTGDETRFLYHMLTYDMESVRTQYTNMIKAIDKVELKVTKIWLYTVDTRHANPEFNDPVNKQAGLLAQSDAEEQIYTWVYNGLRSIGTTERRFHPWGKVGEATVPASGTPVFNPNN